MQKPRTAILLLSVGTPDSPDSTEVRKYLFSFLNDKRVIDIHWFLRRILVSLIIVPFRTPKSAKLYKRLWTEKGSPLLINGLAVKEKLQKKAGDDYIVEFATNYGHPNIKEITERVLKQGVNRFILFPLFPQYSGSATGSAIEKVLKILAGQDNMPAIKTITQYYDHPAYLEAIEDRVRQYDLKIYDHVLMSFHGLPLSQVNKSHQGKSCEHFNCRTEVTENNIFCYQAACYATSRLLAGKLNIDINCYTVCFQSRFAEKWLSPFTSDVLTDLAGNGKKRVLVICPSFASDCLETTIEIGEEGRDLFLRNGGLQLTLVESLNDSEKWVDSIFNIVS
jgi:ferrochelatase